jgi:hypothetical protein
MLVHFVSILAIASSQMSIASLGLIHEQTLIQGRSVLCTDYLRKIIVQGRSSKTTKVGDIMTEEVHFLFLFFIFIYR